VRLLLDTVTFLWLVAEPEQLSLRAREAIVAPGNDVFLSAVSTWEIAVKHALRRLPLPEAVDKFVPEQRERHGVESLPLEEEATLHLPRLPTLHRDPFDRMLICQAIAHGLTVVTPDRDVRQYPVRTLW
jgi:PIN domain nuclease of toxin-antitoxin system